MFPELVSPAGIFHRTLSHRIRNLNFKRKTLPKGNLGVKHPNCFSGTQAKLVQYSLGTFLDIRIDSTVDCGSFHAINMLRLQHAVNIFPVPGRVSPLAFGMISCASRRHDKSAEGMGISCTGPLGLYFCGSSKRPARIPGTVMSSSNASHRRANPFTSTATSFSCSSVAAASRVKRSAGKPTNRPSWSSINIVLPSVQARTAAGSKEIGASASMAVIICFSELLLVFENQTFDLTQVVRSDASVACQKNGRFQPEFAVSVRCPDMDMRGLIALVRIKMKSE